jgi:hypothetical protein
MTQVGWAEGIGYLASLLVLSTFYMKTMLPLRGVAIASNVAFMAYGLAGGIYPVFVLHVLLLPLNCLRLHQMRRLIRKVREASRGEMAAECGHGRAALLPEPGLRLPPVQARRPACARERAALAYRG